MNLDGIDMNAIGDIIGSLSPDDIASLKGMAQSLLSGQDEQKETPNTQNQHTQKQSAQNKNSEPAFDLESLTKIASMMNLLQTKQQDPICDLLYALRPMLKEDRQVKVDQAAKMIQLFSLLPKIKELNL